MQFKDILKTVKIYLCIIVLCFSLQGCIETPEDAMDSYEYQGPEGYAEMMVNSGDVYPILETVFRDSIITKIVNELPFERIAGISKIIKDHGTFNEFIKATPTEKITEAIHRLSPIECANLYQSYHTSYPVLTKIYGDYLPEKFKRTKFDEAIKTYDILSKTPLSKNLPKTTFKEETILDKFKKFNPIEGAKFYLKYRNYILNVDTVYTNYVLPVIINAPYPVLKEIFPILNKTEHKMLLENCLNEAKEDYIFEIKEEIDLCKNRAIEALDRIIIPSIELELDSIANKESDKITNKFIGGFLNIRKLALTFGRDEKKFKKIWDNETHGEKYDECIDKHIQKFLNEIFLYQRDVYMTYTKKDRKKIVYEFYSQPISINYPKDTKLIQSYIESNKFGYLKSIGEWLPYIGDAIFIYDTIAEEISQDNDGVEKLEDKDAFRLFCKYLILGQISDSYYENFRNKTIEIINLSYNRLHTDIINQIK